MCLIVVHCNIKSDREFHVSVTLMEKICPGIASNMRFLKFIFMISESCVGQSENNQ